MEVLLLLKCCFKSTETVGLLGTGAQDVHLDFHTAPDLCIMEVGEVGDYIPIATLAPPNNSWIQMGSDESHFNVSLIVRDKVTRQCPQTTTFLKRKESRSGIEQRSFRLPA